MKTLVILGANRFENYTKTRVGSRAIIVQEGNILLTHESISGWWLIPGGGIEEGENPIDAMIREVREEVGLEIIKDTIREFGYVHRIQKGKYEPVFIQDNYYYFCEVYEGQKAPCFSESERAEGFEPAFVSLEKAIKTNEIYVQENTFDSMIERELRIMKMVREELGL